MRSHRTSFGGVLVGMLVALAMAFVLILIGAALYAPLGIDELTRESRTGALATMAAIGLTLSLYVGARFAASDGRAVVSRDGALHGFVLWAAASVVAGIWAIGAYSLDFLDLSLLDVSTLAWGGLAVELLALVSSIVGGTHGARAEARAIGLIDVRPKEWIDVDDLDPGTYEQTYYADQSRQ